jgi:hypothetical protein
VPLIESLQPFIVFVNHPEYLTGATFVGKFVDYPDKGAARTRASLALSNEEVLQIKHFRGRPGKGHDADMGKTQGSPEPFRAIKPNSPLCLSIIKAQVLSLT